MVAMFEGSDTEPTEEYLHHYAGNGGYGGASYIDDVVFRDRDPDGNGSLDERIWYAQNRHHDVVAIVNDSGHQLETVRYSSYGVPIGEPGGDADSDGDCDAGNRDDTDQIQTWANASTWDFRGDMDLDGDVDNSDKGTAQGAPFNGAALGRGALSLPEVASRRGYAGYVHDSNLTNLPAQVRNRTYTANLGRWDQRDSLEYVDGPSVYDALRSNPMRHSDPSGLAAGGLGVRPPIPCPGGTDPRSPWISAVSEDCEGINDLGSFSSMFSALGAFAECLAKGVCKKERCADDSDCPPPTSGQEPPPCEKWSLMNHPPGCQVRHFAGRWWVDCRPGETVNIHIKCVCPGGDGYKPPRAALAAKCEE